MVHIVPRYSRAADFWQLYDPSDDDILLRAMIAAECPAEWVADYPRDDPQIKRGILANRACPRGIEQWIIEASDDFVLQGYILRGFKSNPLRSDFLDVTDYDDSVLDLDVLRYVLQFPGVRDLARALCSSEEILKEVERHEKSSKRV